MSPQQSEGSIYISSIALEVREQFGKPVCNVIFKTSTGSTKEIPGEFPLGHTHNEVFNPALKLSARDQLDVLIQYQSGCCGMRSTLRITAKQSEIVTQAQDDEHGNGTHVTFYKNTQVTISFSRHSAASKGARDDPLPSTTVEGPRDGPLLSTIAEISNDVSLPPTTVEKPRAVPLPLPPPELSNDISSTTPESSTGIPLPSLTGESFPRYTHLSPTTSEIIRICPRFRVLIIGNSGVGKTTLIQKVFGVKEVDVSDASRGWANIDREFIAAENELFVVHDSLGLEAAEGNNLEKVKHFIDDRQKQENLRDRLHAVWVCLAVPYAKGRLLEAGMEEFLRNRKKILGDVPIVVVLTKLDLLDNHLMLVLRGEGVEFKTIEEAKPFLEPRRTAFLKEYCSKPLLRAAHSDIPHVAISTVSGYGLEPTISGLVKTTTSEIERYIKADPSYAATTEQASIERNAPWYIAGMAQRVSIEEKVDLAIAMGRKRYWRNLGACFGFSPETVREYLLVLHEDIIRAWNFHDPEEALQDEGLKTALLDTSDFVVEDVPDGRSPSASFMTLLLNDPASVVITLPLTGTVALVKLCYQIHKSAKTIAKRFTAYIVDLIYVMKILFILAPQGSITPQNVAFAFEVYKKSSYRNRVHLELKDFSTGSAVLPGGRDVVVDKIETLVRRYDITDEEVSRWRSRPDRGRS